MHARSRSEPNCYDRYPVKSFTSRSFPSALNSFSDVKEVIEQIMQDDDHEKKNEFHNWKEHMNFLESKPFSATVHIKKLEASMGEGGWTDERIQSVSQAMKQFICESEERETEMKEKTERLQMEICKQKEYIERMKENEKQQENELDKKLQKHRNESDGEIKQLQQAMKEKEKGLSVLKKAYDNSRKDVLKLSGENELFVCDSRTRERSQCNEIEQLKKEIDGNVYDRHQLENEILAKTSELTALKVSETKKKAEIMTKNQVIAQKDTIIKEIEKRRKIWKLPMMNC